MKACLVTIILLHNLFSFGQGSSDPNFIQFPFKGIVFLNNNERIKVKGISYTKSDSVKLFPKNSEQYNLNYTNVMNIQAASNIKQVVENKHAFRRGALVGTVVGFGLGYLIGWNSYDDKFSNTDEENMDEAKTRGFLFGLGSIIPSAFAGALVGGIIIRKRFQINGDKQKLTQALDKIYQ